MPDQFAGLVPVIEVVEPDVIGIRAGKVDNDEPTAVAGDDGKSGVLCRLQQTVAELVDDEPLDGTAVSGRRARHGIP